MIDRARERLAAAIPDAVLAELAAPLQAAAERGVALDLVVGDGTGLGLPVPDGEHVRIWRRPDLDPDGSRLAVVVGDGEETVLADLGRDRPEGMWTHHPAVALLATEHLRAFG